MQGIEQVGVLVTTEDLGEVTGRAWKFLDNEEVRKIFAGDHSTVAFLSRDEATTWVLAHNPGLGKEGQPWILLNSQEDMIYDYSSSLLGLMTNPSNLGLLRGEIPTISTERRNSWRHPKRPALSWRNLWGMLS